MSETALGTYWDEESLHFIETTQDIPSKIVSVPFLDENSQVKGLSLSAEGMQLVAKVQEAFTTHGILSSSAYLSLPTKDIIFRSFSIPWMPTNEIKGVVDFEASKYIPFSLEELSFAYHPITITEDGNKKIRIIFVAIKKETLDNYVDILNQTGLNVDIVEPESLSMIRALDKKGALPAEGAVALVEQLNGTGKIVVIEDKIPQFVREFQITTDQSDQENLISKLTNEIKISLDYFSRQGNDSPINEVLYLSDLDAAEAQKQLESELDYQIRAIDYRDILGEQESPSVGHLNAYGAALISNVDLPANFFLSGKKPKKVIKFKKPSSNKLANFKYAIIAAVVAVALIGGTYFGLKGSVSGPKAKVANLESQLGAFKDSATEKLDTDAKNLRKKVAALKGVRVDSNINTFLRVLPDLLPEGIWIKDLNITYTKQSKPQINFSGYAYVENTMEQFGLINKMIKTLNGNKELSKYFKDYDLLSFRADSFQGYPVTSFNVRCH